MINDDAYTVMNDDDIADADADDDDDGDDDDADDVDDANDDNVTSCTQNCFVCSFIGQTVFAERKGAHSQLKLSKRAGSQKNIYAKQRKNSFLVLNDAMTWSEIMINIKTESVVLNHLVSVVKTSMNPNVLQPWNPKAGPLPSQPVQVRRESLARTGSECQ